MKAAIVTQSYKNDFEECKLLCESIDKFVSADLHHFIFVNDEDYFLFKIIENERHTIYKKSTIMPKYFIRIPWKIVGHHFHISPFTLPVREWILQQICKLGVFDVIDSQYDLVLNIDSEAVFMRPFSIENIMRDNYSIAMYKSSKVTQPSHDEYYRAARKLLGGGSGPQHDYMSTPVCFKKNNLNNLLAKISSRNIFHSWKFALCNTYRFSENYLYGIFCSEINDINTTKHFTINKRLFPMIKIKGNISSNTLQTKIMDALSDKDIFGVLMQKTDRKTVGFISIEQRKEIIYKIWKK